MTSPSDNNFERHTVDAVPALSEGFLRELVAELDNDDIVGIILGGSYVRGDATPYSDIDLGCFYKDDAALPAKSFFYRNSLLVSVSPKTVASSYNDLTRPEKAIFLAASPCLVLLDKDGSVKQLVREIAAFRWEPLQQAANEYASLELTLAAELVHKILSEILRRDDMAIAYATAKLLFELTNTVAVQRGVAVRSDRVYYLQVQTSVGIASVWSRYHRIVAGIDELPASVSSIKVRAVAALHLYQETAMLLRPVLQPDHSAVVEQALRVFQEAGPRLRL
ncbi:MAG: nucleotidyltransferase domain-containing protein [Chloroflexota bacterium]|nr:nucleotidyltransferase domain-containing protein [Chloroflexota bacterium]